MLNFSCKENQQMTESEFNKSFRQFIRESIMSDKEENKRLNPEQDGEKRDAISDLLLGFMKQKQIDALDYNKCLNTVDLQKGVVEPEDLTKDHK